VGLVGNLLPTVAAEVLPQGAVPIEIAGRVLELDDESRGPKGVRLAGVWDLRRLVPERRVRELGGWYAGHVVDQDSGVPLREGRGAVGGQETDGLVVSVAGRLIAGGQPVGVASVTARKEAQRWPGVAVACQRSRRCRPGDEAGGRGCEQRNERPFPQ